MRDIPYCRECAFYGGRKNGIGTCNYGETPFSAEHIKSDFWCINGSRKGCQTCLFKPEDKHVGRCLYCKSVHDDVGEWVEWAKISAKLVKT